MTLTGLVELGLLVLAVILMIVFAIGHRRSAISFRQIRSLSRLSHSAQLVVEAGSRLHFSLGSGDMLTQNGAPALAGLALMRRLGETASLSDRAPIATTGSGLLNLLAQDTLRSAHDSVAGGQPFEMTNARLAGFTPFSYAAGVISPIRDENISSNILIGNFGPEVGLMTEAAARQDSALIGASDNLTGQAVLYAASSETLIGEELFAAGAYVNAGAFHASSLLVQDILRWLIIAALIVGAGLKLLGRF